MISDADSVSGANEACRCGSDSSKRVVQDSYIGCARAVSERVDARRPHGWNRYADRERIGFGGGVLGSVRSLGASNPLQAFGCAPAERSSRD